MSIRRAAVVVAAICLMVSCGSGGPGGTGGTVGTGGSGGRGGTTGTGGSGGQASCAACFACVDASCATQISQCQSDTGCAAIYACAHSCTTTVNDCVSMNMFSTSSWAPVSTCLGVNCLALCAN
jgi:hypothetical protein